MRRVYLSFLGTNNYLPCNYIFDNHPPVKTVRFVQEATVSWCCGDWHEDDKILIFTTEEAHNKNWIDNGHRDRDDNIIPGEGLESRLALLNMAAKIVEVRIPTGKKEEEIWDIFSIIIKQIGEQDELYLDITHAFRSLPLLATVIINYAKVMKNIQVKAINYGAMEAVGSYWEVEKIDIAKRNIPVFDLLPFDQLLDWSTAIDKFLSSGDATGVQQLTMAKSIARKKELRRQDTEADGLTNMAGSLGYFSETLATCRGKNISQAASSLKDRIEKVQGQNLIRPLTPLLTKLQDGVADFSGDEVRDGIAATIWCLEHNLIQQGFTILQETIFTFILKEATDEETNQVDKRNLVGKAVAIEQDNILFEKWDETAKKNKVTINQIREWLHARKDLLDNLKNLSANRNDLNHSGMNDSPMSAAKFSEKLKGYISIFKDEVTRDR